MAPAYFVYLLQAYCYIGLGNERKFSPGRFILLGSSVLSIFGISLAPFIATGQISALLNRLFPFTRGLCHAYWAPNVWALYAGLDRFLIIGKVNNNNNISIIMKCQIKEESKEKKKQIEHFLLKNILKIKYSVKIIRVAI